MTTTRANQSLSTANYIDYQIVHDLVQLTPSTATLLVVPPFSGPAMDRCLKQRQDDMERALLHNGTWSRHYSSILPAINFCHCRQCWHSINNNLLYCGAGAQSAASRKQESRWPNSSLRVHGNSDWVTRHVQQKRANLLLDWTPSVSCHALTNDSYQRMFQCHMPLSYF